MRDLVANVGRSQGLIAADRGDEDAAAEAFSAGLAAARSLGERWLLAELLADYGRFLASVGRFDDAEPLLDEAQQLWEGMGAIRWLERIEAARSPAKVTA
jgi:tetratricopeptide (TPR) repeat protein